MYRNLEVLERPRPHPPRPPRPRPGAVRRSSAATSGEYLYCERCGAVALLPADELDPVREQIRELFGYAARFTHFAIVGLCGECSAEPSPAASVSAHP